MRHVLGLVTLLMLPAFAAAQDEMPALPDEQPAVKTEVPDRPRAPVAPAAPGEAPPPVGTTVIGEQESPIGLYIMPWRQSAAQAGLDRPARLLDEQLLPLDPDVFYRQVQYYRALSEHLEKSGLITPVDR